VIKENSGIPTHVAIIMDGNGRWAKKRGLPRLTGHEAGVKRIRSVVKVIVSRGIKYLTLYGFSTENWSRPEEEVKGLFNLLEEGIDREAAALNAQNVKITHLGRLYELPEGVQNAISRAVKLTEKNTLMVLNFAFNYGGRTDIIDAARKLIDEKFRSEQIDEKVFAGHLYTTGMPDVDLVIRTGGELRISNFLLWQAAYAEYYFTPTLWPDFAPGKVKQALDAYQKRTRRFGGL
jgi:undecaprenyl diphosphate synthase